MKNFNIFGVHQKIWLLGGSGSMINQYEGALPKKGAWTVQQFKGEPDKKDRDGVFEGG